MELYLYLSLPASPSCILVYIIFLRYEGHGEWPYPVSLVSLKEVLVDAIVFLAIYLEIRVPLIEYREISIRFDLMRIIFHGFQ